MFYKTSHYPIYTNQNYPMFQKNKPTNIPQKKKKNYPKFLLKRKLHKKKALLQVQNAYDEVSIQKCSNSLIFLQSLTFFFFWRFIRIYLFPF